MQTVAKPAKSFSKENSTILSQYSVSDIFLLAEKMQEFAEDIHDMAWIEQQKGKKKKYVSADVLDTIGKRK